MNEYKNTKLIMCFKKQKQTSFTFLFFLREQSLQGL
jgi:hypothetical protein